MQDYISANLPAIDFDQTRQFYAFLGFQCSDQSQEWMIMQRGSLQLEFFHHPQLDSKDSWFSACIRTQDLALLFNQWCGLDWAQYPNAKITNIEHLNEIDLFCVIDLNGSLLRCIQLKQSA
ncbi:hypothetical protein [Acinetobacter silvestris]|uniref:Bleomycin resistance protein n=1 Tax=Acinetobacter silvestris TaxID=1977882 RepID=A0A1Y3CEF8_9GAMM|nr:hypothetical protein [Acinetobacter silvestris]OTG65467.1 hypothetical protein B9T28_08365 [Acinetobacter silvestris]